MNRARKIGAVLLTGAMLLSFAACSTSDTTWIAKSGENKLPAGVYIYNMMQNYYMATYQVEDPAKDVLKQKVEDKDAALWISDKTLETTRRDMAVMAKFKELGLTLTEEEITYCQTKAGTDWEQSNEMFEENGIAKSSVVLLNELAVMDSRIFDATYGKGGSKEVSETDTKKYYSDNYLKAGVISIQLPTKPSPAADATEESKKADEDTYQTALASAKTEADNWYVQAQVAVDAGKDFNEIINLYNKGRAQDPIAYDMTQNNIGLMNTAETSLEKAAVDELVKAEIGKPVKIETETQILIAVKSDINADPADFQNVQPTIVHSMKDTEYTEEMKTAAAAETIEINQDSVNRYVPKNIKLG